MVWVKLTDDFPEAAERAKLSSDAFRIHVEGLCWAMRRENGGLLDWIDVRKACATEDPKAAIRELIEAGWWAPAGPDGHQLQILHSMDDQPEPDVIEARRCTNADRQRRKRRKAAKLEVSRRDDPRDNHRDDPRDPGRVGSGRVGDTTPESDLLSQPVAPKGEEVQPQLGSEDWPEVARPTVDQVRDTLHRHDNQDYCKSCGMTAPGHTRSCKAQRKETP